MRIPHLALQPRHMSIQRIMQIRLRLSYIALDRVEFPAVVFDLVDGYFEAGEARVQVVVFGGDLLVVQGGVAGEGVDVFHHALEAVVEVGELFGGGVEFGGWFFRGVAVCWEVSSLVLVLVWLLGLSWRLLGLLSLEVFVLLIWGVGDLADGVGISVFGRMCFCRCDEFEHLERVWVLGAGGCDTEVIAIGELDPV